MPNAPLGPIVSRTMRSTWPPAASVTGLVMSVQFCEPPVFGVIESLKGYEMMLQAAPDNASLHDDAGLLYGEAGNLERAARHFAESLRLRPDSAAAHYNLGTALLALGKRDEARRAFERALQLDPDYANAYRSLAIGECERRGRKVSAGAVTPDNGLAVTGIPDPARE